MDAVELERLIKWLMSAVPTRTQVLTETCERLTAAGVPLWRVGVFVRTLHPDAFGRSFVWRPGKDVGSNTASFDLPDWREYKRSPLAILYGSGHEVRYRLDDPESRRFPFFDDMREEGVTDYIALPMHFTDGTTHATSWTTKAQGGFTDKHLAALREVIPPFARLAEIFAMQRTAAALLDTYVGNRAGERIWAGQIRRGHAEAMQAAIWLSDLRGFTALSDRLAASAVVDILNQYFDCQVPAILKYGGEILKFMATACLRYFRSPRMAAISARSARARWRRRARRAPVSTPCAIRAARAASASASASRCTLVK